jgi:hypothetical protein
VTIVALAWGERVFWRLFEVVMRAFGVLFGALRQAQGPSAPISYVRALADDLLWGAVRGRGPPWGAASI